MISLINNFNQIFGKIIPIGVIIFGVTSCSVAQHTAGENDGIYYDPSATPTEETTVTEVVYQKNTQPVTQPVRIGGKYFDNQGEAPDVAETESYTDRSTAQDETYVVYDESDDYVYWGEDEGVEIEINNYYSPYSSFGWYRPFSPYRYGWYRPMFSFSMGWGNWGYRPFYSPYYGFYSPYYGGFYNPYYGFYSPYGPYSPYYHPRYYGYGYGSGYGHNHFYRNEYIRNVYRGKGNRNGITRQSIQNERVTGNRRNASSQANQQPIRTRNSNISNTTNGSVRVPKRKSNEVSNATDNSPVRIRPRTRISGEMRTGEVRNTPQIRTPRRSNSQVRTPQPPRTRTRVVAPKSRTKSQTPTYNSTPRRTPQRNTTINNSTSSRSSSMGSQRSSSSRRSGGRRR